MIRVQGVEFDELTRQIDAFDEKFLAVAQDVMDRVADEIGQVTIAAAEPVEPPPPGEPLVSLDTLGMIAPLWAAGVTATLFPDLVQTYLQGGQAIADAINAALGKLIPEPSDAEELDTDLATEYLKQAENRMVRFSDVLWEISRAQLVEGFMKGESIAQLRDRLVAVPGLAAGRASAVARTEIVSSSNAGSIGMVQLMGMQGFKVWQATEDSRTRPTHSHPPIGADGQRVGLNEWFQVGGARLFYPGDPSGPPEEVIQCRCSILYQLDDEPLTAAGPAGGTMADPTWSGVIAVEGQPTGDQREFAPGALTWVAPDVITPLLWQMQGDQGHRGSVVVGNVQEIARAGNVLFGRGTMDAEGSYGAEAIRLMRKRMLGGVSIDPDQIEAPDVEITYGPGVTAMDGPAISMTRYHSGRIRGVTLCAIPAFIEAQIALDPEVSDMGGMDGMGEYDGMAMVAAAIPPHKTATVEGPWDAAAQEKRLDSPMPVATADDMYAWIDDSQVKDGQVTKSAVKFPHHEVSADGTPGAANLTACSAGIAALRGARGGTTIPDSERQAVYNHLAAHLRDGGQTPPKFGEETVTFTHGGNVTVTELPEAIEGGGMRESEGVMTAAAYVLTIPDVPPAWWFDEPTDVTMSGALTVTDEGRIYGLVAPAGVDHRSFQDRKVKVPMGNVDYSLFMGRETIVEGGERIVTGAITMDCGHADTGYRDPAAALDHYDNSCSIVASVRIGENASGVWVAGSILPGLSARELGKMMSSVLSGDWRPHRQRNGWREFAGALLVPVPGFAMARTEASVRLNEGALVASSVPVEYAFSDDSCGCNNPSENAETSHSFGALISVIERSVGLDAGTRIATLDGIVNRT